MAKYSIISNKCKRASGSFFIVFLILMILILSEVVHIYLKSQFIIYNTRRALEFSVTSLLGDHYKYVFNSAKASWATSVDENQQPIILEQDLRKELKSRLPVNDHLVAEHRGKVNFALQDPELTYRNHQHLQMRGKITLIIPIYFYGREVKRLSVDLYAHGEYQLKGKEGFAK